MKLLSINETQQVSGGIGFTFLMSMFSGATGCSGVNTALYDGLWWGTIGFFAGLPLMGVGALITTPIGFVSGVIEGSIGYAIGSIFYNPPAPVSSSV